MRWRTYTDRLIVLAVILAAWQVGSFLVGPYWLSSPGAVGALLRANLERRADTPRRLYRRGGADRHARRRRAGGAAAVPAPAPSRDGRDPRSLHGRRLRRPQARLRAAVHPLVRHRHRIQDRAGGGCRLLHRLFQRAIRRARARSPARPDGTDRRRRRAARSAARGSAAAVPHILAGFASRCPTPSAAPSSPS